MSNRNIGYIILEESPAEPSNVVLQHKLFNGKVVGKGIFQTANEKNRNGRYYSREELFPQIHSERIQELLNAGYLRAEMGHPQDANLQRQSQIDDRNTCARFLTLWTEGDDIWATFCGTNNEHGRSFDADLREGCKPAWSLRALGSVEQTHRGAEVHNLRIICWDNVIYPSHRRAYTTELVTESTNVVESSIAESGKLIPMLNDDVIRFIQADSKNIKFVRECFDFIYTGIMVNEAGSKVVLTTNSGDTLVINLESYVHNQLMNYADKINQFV